jgi:uncharacterized protein (TIGR04255 family)
MSAQTLPTYKTPPLSEVTFGVQFAPLTRFKSAHIGLLWERFRKEFPNVEQVAPIADPGVEIPLDSSTGLPHPRTWFINASESRLVQFQPDRLYYNWRTKEQEPAYPRFTEIASCFFETYAHLQGWADEATLGTVDVRAFSLAYTNHIAIPPDSDVSQLAATILTDFHWEGDRERFLPKPRALGWSAVFPLPEERGHMTAKVSEGLRTFDSQKILVLELAAGGKASSAIPAATREWFDIAHAYIVNAFADLTRIEIQKTKWGRL